MSVGTSAANVEPGQSLLLVLFKFVAVPLVIVAILVPLLRLEYVQTSSFPALFSLDQSLAEEGLRRIETTWQPEYAPMIVEVGSYARYDRHREKLESILQAKTGQSIRINPPDLNNEWYRWLGKQPPLNSRKLNQLRADFYSAHASPLMNQLGEYFAGNPPTTIRCEEIRWGGVFRDMIFPIREPQIISVSQAEFLNDDNKIFGVEINGEARAYPRRILGHHEMIIDTIGGVPITGVYCPLCETMIAFHSRTTDGVQHVFGTSGYLYRSNKLMYDAATKSLWQTMTGEPVVGQLVGQGIVLEQSPVVTTTWGEWRRRHPETKTVSLEGLPFVETNDHGFRTDYSEGNAYRGYFESDEIAYDVLETDDRLN